MPPAAVSSCWKCGRPLPDSVANEVMRYAMTLCSATHADSECASEAAKKYVRLGASPVPDRR